jgi:hypothetical protein
MHKIIIIGTDPPCPRCGLLTQTIKAKIDELNIPAELTHLSLTDKEAAEIAAGLGLKPGTAKDVAKQLNLEMDMPGLTEILRKKPQDKTDEYITWNNCNWSPELDEFLNPYQEKAKDAGILMTPVVIINNKIMHQGSVPPLEMLNNWLSELKS